MRRLLFLLACLAGCLGAAPAEADHLQYLKSMEGYRLMPYRDTDGSVCVGIGHNLTAHNEPVKSSYTHAEVAALFRADLKRALGTARASLRDFDRLPDNVQLVVVSVIWCVGPTGFQGFTRFRAALDGRDWRRAAHELHQSRWFDQVSQHRAHEAYRILITHAATPQVVIR